MPTPTSHYRRKVKEQILNTPFDQTYPIHYGTELFPELNKRASPAKLNAFVTQHLDTDERKYSVTFQDEHPDTGLPYIAVVPKARKVRKDWCPQKPDLEEMYSTIFKMRNDDVSEEVIMAFKDTYIILAKYHYGEASSFTKNITKVLESL